MSIFNKMKRYKHSGKVKGIFFFLLVMSTTLFSCQSGSENNHLHEKNTTYTCPMHPQVLQEEPGNCPICGMELVPVTQTGHEMKITLTDRQIALGNIKAIPIGLGNIGNNTFLTGEITTNKEGIEIISSRAPGRIERLYVKETGRHIDKGQPLYGIYSEELLTLQKEYLLTLKQYQELGSGNERYASFMEAAKQKLLLYGMTEAQIANLAKKGTVSPRVTFVAPSSGVVTEIAVTEGQYVNEGSALYKIEDFNTLWVEAELYPREAALVEKGDTVQVIVNGYEHEAVTGKVIFISPEFRSGSQILTLRAEIGNPEGNLIPGMQARIVLNEGSQEVLSLPADAVIRGERGAHIWLKTAEGTFEPREVTTGLETFDKTEILTGLEPGDSVVVSGAYLLYGELVLKKGMKPLESPSDASGDGSMPGMLGMDMEGQNQ